MSGGALASGVMRLARFVTSRPYRHEYRRWAVLDRAGGPEDAVVIAGSGRSGTTWVEELINSDGSARILFEPFRSSEVPALRSIGEYRYLRQDDERYVTDVERLLSGYPRHNRWINHQNYARIARWRIIKEIRAHGLLGWTRAHFPDTPMVFVMRHPITVAASQQRMGWRDRLAQFTSQPELVHDHLAPHLDIVESLQTPWQRLIGQWCIENMLALRTLGASDAALVLYEELLTDPAALDAVRTAVGRGVAEPTREVHLAKPSKMARADSAVRHGGDLLAAPFMAVTSDQRRQAMEICAAFGLDDIYGDDPLPNVAAARRRWLTPPPECMSPER